jgi:hypothetical protein
MHDKRNITIIDSELLLFFIFGGRTTINGTTFTVLGEIGLLEVVLEAPDVL